MNNKPDKEENAMGTKNLKPFDLGATAATMGEIEALQAECEKLRKDAERIKWLEDQAKKSQTGISFDYHHYAEDGYVVNHGYRFMRRHFATGFKGSLREAIDVAMQEISHGNQ